MNRCFGPYFTDISAERLILDASHVKRIRFYQKIKLEVALERLRYNITFEELKIKCLYETIIIK